MIDITLSNEAKEYIKENSEGEPSVVVGVVQMKSG